ncbi:hypothetical protein LTR78_009266 [Recurvomyces mirabilis]|uniref:Carbohydrate kinase PfkB domain-containing protein n=1 Tax=Recurvomyces mirabilis TaxID=574656 RepID=A0AAE0WHG2_9PEZI|nr:hypothetical protein LTR78_009266 [Recurvomyces mirabilis]KAK5156173.1 hypothetical protein LTS14_005060 [Recurvomyces mirabilis]
MSADECHGMEQVDFVTLGMFIIDDIYPPPSAQDQTPQKDIIGGAGTYSAIGARLFSPPPTSSKTVGWIIDAGTDFPSDVRSTISSWQTSALIRPRDGLTTRGWNGYGENEHRAFKYLTEKKRLEAEDLTPALLKSKSFHLICSPSRCMTMIKQILARRHVTFGEDEARPLVIWEPVPDLCTPEEFNNTLEALEYVDVISPNHEELAALFGYKHPTTGVDKAAVQEHAEYLLAYRIGPEGKGAVVIRAGKEGCFILSKQAEQWLPAYHQSSSQVIDPTGGGNGFLGGLAIGLVRTEGDVLEAARMGSVAASYCIEQVGMPVLTTPHNAGTNEQERWNGSDVNERLAEFRERTR